GLFVLPRVTSIFTRSAISPGLWLRQQRSRYAIRAGRNLPDKEFRYLRMVIVTTAVYWGLNSQLRNPKVSNRSSYPSSTGQASVHIPQLNVFAWTCVFDKQSLPSILCDHPTLHQYLVSRGMVPLLPKLRGHFAEFLNHSYPERLSIFHLTTCFGLVYVLYTHIT